MAGAGREILNSNPAERLDDHPFILGLPPVRINGVPFSLVLSERRVANHVLVFSICALSKHRVVFGRSRLRRYGVLCRCFVHFLGLLRVNRSVLVHISKKLFQKPLLLP